MLINYRIVGRCLKNSIYRVESASIASKSNAIVEEAFGPITAIGINQAHCKNELNVETFDELCNALERFQNNDSHAAVVYGLGGNFCTGCQKENSIDSKKLLTVCSKPIVAGISGFATGFGFELAMLCDLRVMETTAQIGMDSFPMALSDVFYQRLVRAVGSSVGMDLALTGRNLTAKEALEIGLVNRIVDCGTGIGQGISLAKWVGKYPIENLVAAKSAVYSSLQVLKTS